MNSSTQQASTAFPSLDNLTESLTNSTSQLELDPRPELLAPSPYASPDKPQPLQHFQQPLQVRPQKSPSPLQHHTLILKQQSNSNTNSNYLSTPDSSTSTMRHTNFDTNTQPQTPSLRVQLDAPTIYKQVRQVLNDGEFEMFASIIAQFNATTLPTEDAMQRIRALIKNNETLVIQMEILMKTSIEGR